MANGRGGPRISRCSFCEKSYRPANLVVAGQGRAAVCHECIRPLANAAVFAPPFIISKAEIDDLFDRVAAALDEVAAAIG